MASASTTDIFASFQEFINDDQEKREDIRTVVRDLEQKGRQMLAIAQAIHQPDGIKKLPEICRTTRTALEAVKETFSLLKSKIPQDQYYRFHDHWRFVMQRLCFLAALVTYLESNRLSTREETAQLLGVKIDRTEGFHLDLDDYLMGLLMLASELSRLAVNAVTAGDFGRPIRIANFLGELDSGFRLLNLKNDSLRKRFDGLKYDLKKVEEVVYDVTIRGLKPAEHATSEEQQTT